MPKSPFTAKYVGCVAACALTALIVPWSLVHAGRAIQERRPADPQGVVEILDVSGLIEVTGWDRPEVEVTGTAGDNVDRVDVTSAGNRTSIHVVARVPHRWNSADSEARLTVHVPAKSALWATLVSADLKLTGVQGDLKLQTVSGTVNGDVNGEARVNTVSGDVRLTAHAAKAIEVRTISGDIQLTGGGGEVEITTVSGDAKIDLGVLTRGRFKSVSGDLSAVLTLDPNGQIDGESVSGGISLNFAAPPAADFDVQSFSGDISNCFGPKPTESKYGPGSRLVFENGEGHAHVRIATKSGDVTLCAKSRHNAHVAMASKVAATSGHIVLPYVL